MIFHRSFTGSLALSALLLGLSASASYAFESSAFGDRLKAALSDQGTAISWTNLSESGSQIVLEGATVKASGAATPITLGNVTLDDVTEESGGYKVGKVTLPAYSTSKSGTDLDVSGATITGVRIPAAGATDPLASILLYETADVASVSAKRDGKQVATVSNLHLQASPPVAGSKLEISGAAEKFTADLSYVEDPKAKKLLEALGYTTFSGKFQMAGTWQPGDGRLDLSKTEITVDNAGKLDLTFDLGGYTVDFIKAVNEMKRKMADKPEGGDRSTQGLAMLGLMQQLNIHGATIRFEDDSLTGKVLEYVAGQQGVKPTDVANQAKAIMPFLLAQLNNPELTQSVTEAVTKYLDNPQSIEIKAAPASPVPLALVVAGAMASPKDLPKTLGVTVTANE